MSEFEPIGPVTPLGAGPHVTDDELLLDYYNESEPADRASRAAHLAACDACRALDREMRAVLALVETDSDVEAPPGFGREMWSRVEPHVVARPRPQQAWWPASSELARMWRVERRSAISLRQFALVGGMAALLLASFTLGRVWERAPKKDDAAPPAADANVIESRPADSVTERLLRAEMEDHLERSQRVLVDVANTGDGGDVSLASDRSRAADLVAAGRLYRRAADRVGDVEMRDLLEDVERVLVDVANGSSERASKELSDVRTRIDEQDLVFRLRVAASEIRERQRRTQPTW